MSTYIKLKNLNNIFISWSFILDEILCYYNQTIFWKFLNEQNISLFMIYIARMHVIKLRILMNFMTHFVAINYIHIE